MPWPWLPSNPVFGDPTFAGWLITVGYLGTSYLCWCVGRSLKSPGAPASAQARYWSAISGTLLLLGINKQLDVQLWLTHWGRKLALAEGWYPQRGVAKVTFVVVLGLALWSAFLWLLWSVRDVLAQTAFASAGTAVLITFVLLRATSFDVADVLLRYHEENVTWTLELVGLVLVGLSIGRAARTRGWRIFAWADIPPDA